MRPAQQYFGAQGLALGIDLELEVQLELPRIDGTMQRALQRGAGVELRLHGGVEEAKPVAPVCFGLVHGDVGAFEQVFGAGVVAPKQTDADAGAGALDVACQRAGFFQGDQHLLGHAPDLLARAAFLRGQIVQKNDEFVAAEARDGARRADDAAQGLGDFDQ